MDYRQSFSISAVGMTYERARVDAAALNLANANTALASDGTGFRPLRVVNNGMFNDTSFAGVMAGNRDFALSSTPGFSLQTINAAPRLVHEPGHPLANDKGFVAYPGVDVAVETVTMMSAMRAYEANVAAMNTSKNMALKALEIGGGN